LILLQEDGIDTTTAEVGAILAATALPIVPVASALLRRLFSGPNPSFARWGFSHVALVAAFGVALFGGVAWARGGELPSSGLGDLLLTAGILLACCGLVAAIASRLDPNGLRCLGLWPGRHVRAAIAGILGYAMLFPGILGVDLLWPWVLDAIGAHPEPQAVTEKLRLLAPAERPVAILLGVALMPLLEEILFRAFLQPLLVQHLSARLGIVATSLVFALLHGASVFLPIFALSLVLGAIMHRTQRLFAVWAVHALHNGFMFLLLFALPGEPAPLSWPG